LAGQSKIFEKLVVHTTSFFNWCVMGLGFSLKRSLGWVLGNYTPRKTLPDTSLVSLKELADFVATMQAELDASNLFDGPQTSNSAPVNTVAPLISGTSSVGSVLTATTGTWTGTPTPTLAGQWFRGASAISGATGTTYTILVGDVGQAIRYRQTATNIVGSASADSNTITATTATTWILDGGTWNDAGNWDDAATWNDGASSATSNYIARVESAGGSPTPDGIALIDEIFDAAADESVTVNSGWFFGSAVNVSKNLAVNLVDGKSSMTPGASLHADSVQTEGMLTLRVTAAGQGLVTNGESLFTNVADQPYSILFLMNSIGDPIEIPQPNSEANATQFSQGAGGYIRCANHQAILNNQSQFFAQGGSNGGSNTTRELQMDMQFVWVHFDGSGNWCAYHASQASGTPTAITGGTISGRFEYGNIANQVPASLSVVGIVRFDGALTGTQRTNIFNRIWRKATSIVKTCLIVGNSVTITGTSDARISWPRRFGRWGLYNNILCVRRAQGAMRLPKFAPIGYALPGSATPDPDISTMSIDLLDWFRANLFINDDQQNMVGTQPLASVWLHCHNAFPTKLQTLTDEPVRAVMCTQMAHQPRNFGGDNALLPWPAFGDSNWRRTSIATRAFTLADFNGVPTTVADVWTAFNLGWPADVDGTPNDPLNDFANGNPALFAIRPNGQPDAQHPNDDGHLVMFNIYRDAVERVLAL
jgi:hypothetical protein